MFIDTDGDEISDFRVTVADEARTDDDDDAGFTGRFRALVHAVDASRQTTRFFYRSFFFNRVFVEPKNSIVVFTFDLTGSRGLLEAGDTDFDIEMHIQNSSSSFSGEVIKGHVDLSEQSQFKFDGLELLVNANDPVSVGVDGAGPTLWLSPNELHKRRAVVLP